VPPLATVRAVDTMSDSLLRGALVRLAAPNPETDAETMAAWSRDPEFQHLLETGAPRPWTARGIKTDLTEMQGDEKPRERDFPFVIRALANDQLIGFTDLEVNHWSHRNAWISIGIGPRAYWGKGYGTDAMRVLMRFAFAELNLERLTLNVFAYNERAQRSYIKAGFQVEGHQRERLRRGSRRYDMIFMGILRDEWRSREWRSRESPIDERQAQLPAGSD
jgi:RimJ/RimL family protein N-acetyltransferase